MSSDKVKVRLLFADSGTFYQMDLDVPGDSLEGYDRLIDGLQEDANLLKDTYLDMDRLCAAWREGG